MFVTVHITNFLPFYSQNLINYPDFPNTRYEKYYFCTEKVDIDDSTKTENIIIITPKRLTGHEI